MKPQLFTRSTVELQERYEAKLSPRKRRWFPKKFIVTHRISTRGTTNVQVTFWVPDTPRSDYEPKLNMTLNINNQKVGIVFDTSDNASAFLDELCAFLRENKERLDKSLLEALTEWNKVQLFCRREDRATSHPDDLSARRHPSGLIKLEEGINIINIKYQDKRTTPKGVKAIKGRS